MNYSEHALFTIIFILNCLENFTKFPENISSSCLVKNALIICLIEIKITRKYILLDVSQIPIFGKISTFAYVIKTSMFGQKLKKKMFFSGYPFSLFSYNPYYYLWYISVRFHANQVIIDKIVKAIGWVLAYKP